MDYKSAKQELSELKEKIESQEKVNKELTECLKFILERFEGTENLIFSQRLALSDAKHLINKL